MIFHFQQALRAYILIAFTVFLWHLHYSGEITKYINPKYEMISHIGAVIFLLLFIVQVGRIWTKKHEHNEHCHHDHNHDHGNTPFNLKKLVSYAIVIFPLATGYLLPAKTLDASIAAKKGTMLVLSGKAQEVSNQQANLPDVIETPPVESDNTTQIDPELNNVDEYNNENIPPIDDNVQDPNAYSNTVSEEKYNEMISELENSSVIEMTAQNYSAFYEIINRDLSQYIGKTIKFKGFVYKEDGFTSNQLVLGQFLVTHCVADASIVGFLSEFDEASSIDVDTWVQAEGIIELGSYNGVEMPIVKVNNWKVIGEPDQPYLYSLYTN
ncbi:putative membrane protein [Salirhabdus euzebyi]|uniref:Putative membrane protein n=1 Tax=Salirhabdus euzebyi TaxID=394506 RepID=A0A841Q2B7_9BACI|nr:TIGR03943 family protein [Salirhabdus euzebyi]MBB6452365.1 putative membrane protein [Salirhabdus euzebyi]